MPHVQKFAYMLHISAYAIAFFSIFFVQRFKTVKYFWQLIINGIYNEMLNEFIENDKVVQNMLINDHNYDSPLLEVAYAGNMRKNMPHTAYVRHMQHICTTYFKKILRYKPAS